MKNFTKLCFVLCILFSIFVISCKQPDSKEKNTSNIIEVKEDNKLLQYFKETYDGKKIIKAVEGDIDGDGKKDLIIIFNEAKDKNRMVAVVHKDNGYACSNEVAAPISNQKIEFRDIDNKPPTEIVVSGSKDNKVGYAIFRLEDMKLVDLFGEGMKDCC